MAKAATVTIGASALQKVTANGPAGKQTLVVISIIVWPTGDLQTKSEQFWIMVGASLLRAF